VPFINKLTGTVLAKSWHKSVISLPYNNTKRLKVLFEGSANGQLTL